MPRTAAAQRNWLAAGHGHRVPPGTEQPGDLIFWDSYLGPARIGHVMIVWDPTGQATIEARSRATASATSRTPPDPPTTSTRSGASATAGSDGQLSGLPRDDRTAHLGATWMGCPEAVMCYEAPGLSAASPGQLARVSAEVHPVG